MYNRMKTSVKDFLLLYLKEKISKKKALGLGIIIDGILIYER